MLTKLSKPKIILLLILIPAFVLVYLYFFKSSTVGINNHKIYVEVVKTNESRQKGLSGRTSLSINSGMLFIFDSDSKYCMWMKDMKFPIDILWLDSQKKVIETKEEVSPNTYPQEFCPTQNTRYVLEINSGQARTLNIQIGNLVKF